MPVRRVTRGLRFQLTASYGVFFTLLLLALAFIFRTALATNINSENNDNQKEDWGALKGYLRIEHGKPGFFYDHDDTDETATASRLQRVCLILDEHGKVLWETDAFGSLTILPPSRTPITQRIMREIQSGVISWEARDDDGHPYLVRGGVWSDVDETDRRYYVAIGRSIQYSHSLLQNFTWLCWGVVPLAIVAGCWLGWINAGRALNPVLQVARSAQRISGSNLSLRIPSRGAHDELDYLISTFNQMIARLENSFNQIRQFSIDVSHELRTPITIIRGQLEVALFTAQTSEQYRDAIVTSLQDIERLSQIVRALLLLSQAETGQVVLQKSPLDLAVVVHDISEQFEIPAEGAQVHLSVTGTNQPVMIEADRVQIERMLSNLLSNAVKFTPAGGEVRVRLAKLESEAELVVEDTGVGIPADHLPHIFDRFYRVSGPSASASPEKGLGLGLSFVAWIAKAHNGSVNVESEPGKGTRFIVRLPLVPAETPGNEQNLIATHG